MGLFSSDGRSVSAARLMRLERKIDAILDHLQIRLPDDGIDDIRELAGSGRKIEAIKLYRERTGAGLKDAKEAIERGV